VSRTQVPATLGRPPVLDVGLLAVAVLAVSTSGPLIAAIVAPALAISFWRSILGALATVPLAWRERRTHRYRAPSRDRRLMLAAGLLLGAHFATWVPSLRYTSVASATALVATQPIWAALLARRAGVRIPPLAWFGIAVAFGGVLLLTGVDLAHDPATLLGDGLALLGGMLAAAYVTVGERARVRVPVHTYNTVVFAVAGLGLLVVCLIGRQPLLGYSARDWWLILALTAGAQLLGHSVVNRVLQTTSATVVSLAILFEVPGATLIAAWWLGQTPPLAVVPAVALLFAGLAVVIVSGTRRTPIETPPV
jgi:drug/metabolite transporter (DMT)-like permease